VAAARIFVLPRSIMNRDKDINSVFTGNNAQDNDDGTSEAIVSYSELAPKSFLEVVPSEIGTVFAAILANIMTDGLTPTQQNILGNFISAVGSLISYKASRVELDEPEK
jgi:hypothetical protein